MYALLVRHLKRLVRERDDYAHRVVEMAIAGPSTSVVRGVGDGAEEAAGASGSSGLTPEKNHLALEVSESKAKIRKLKQQL